LDYTLHSLYPSETIDRLSDYYFAPYITLAHIFNAPQGWEIKPRSLMQFQFQYVIGGTAEYRIDHQLYTTNRGDLIYHCPNVRHSVNTVNDEPYVCISIVFHFGLSSFPLQQLLGESPYLGNFTDHSIENKLSQLAAQYHQPGLSNQLLCQSLLIQILHELSKVKEGSVTKSKTQEKTGAKLVLIRNYLTKHYKNDIQHKDLEEASCLSRNYIIIKFKKQFGLTPFQYLTRVRVERAKELAIQTNLSIGEIAALVGFADVHTFGRMFKQQTGISLSQFSNSLTLN
jgi:AraC-like DNA-binding protein